nr:hypothetical protein [Paracoccus mutanolyticus]
MSRTGREFSALVVVGIKTLQRTDFDTTFNNFMVVGLSVAMAMITIVEPGFFGFMWRPPHPAKTAAAVSRKPPYRTTGSAQQDKAYERRSRRGRGRQKDAADQPAHGGVELALSGPVGAARDQDQPGTREDEGNSCEAGA